MSRGLGTKGLLSLGFGSEFLIPGSEFLVPLFLFLTPS
jgi:hypothetical protein